MKPKQDNQMGNKQHKLKYMLKFQVYTDIIRGLDLRIDELIVRKRYYQKKLIGLYVKKIKKIS
jgi:hypothetical protein